MVLSIFLYACETWTLTAELNRRLQSMEMSRYRNKLRIACTGLVDRRGSPQPGQPKHRVTVCIKKTQAEVAWLRNEVHWPSKSDPPTHQKKRGGQLEKEMKIQHHTGRDIHETQVAAMDWQRWRHVDRSLEEELHDKWDRWTMKVTCFKRPATGRLGVASQKTTTLVC